MNGAQVESALRLHAALERADVPLQPAAITRELNLRHSGQPFTLRAARLWLRGKTIPHQDRLLCPAEWLGVEPLALCDATRYRQPHRKRRDEGVGDQERGIFELFFRRPVPSRKMVREAILAQAQAKSILPAVKD